MSTNAQAGQQAENAAGTITTAQRALPDNFGGDASANSSSETPSSLPINFEEVSALLYGTAQPPQSQPAAAETGAAVAQPEATPAPEATPEGTPAGETTPPAEPEATAQPEQEPQPATPEATGQPERILPSRIGTGQFAPTTQRAMALMHELNGGKPEGAPGTYTLGQCLNMIASADGGQTITAEPVQAGQPAQPEPTATDVLQGEIEALETQIREAGENQVLFGTELAQAISELTEKKAQLVALQITQQQAQETQVRSHVAQREAVKARVVEQYPTANDKSTILGARVASIIEEWKDPSNPNHANLNRVEAPELVVQAAAEAVASEMATRFGISKDAALNTLRASSAQQAPAATPPQKATPQPQPQTPLPVAGNKVVTVASGSTGTGTAPRQVSEADILAAALNDPDQFSNLLGYGNAGFYIRG